jgi:hypothetical protein
MTVHTIVGVPVLAQSAARGLKKYACPLCMALRGHPADLDAAIGRTRRTRYKSLSFSGRTKLQVICMCTGPACCSAHVPGIMGLHLVWQSAADCLQSIREMSCRST